MSRRERLAAHLVAEEGEVLHAYQDHLGFWTLGVGRLIDKRKGGGISRAESRMLLDNDIARCAQLAASYPWYAGLSEARQDVVCAMIFQLGPAGFRAFRGTHAALAAGQFDLAAGRMLDSLWARQTPARAQRLGAVMRAGVWPEGGAP
jgi:lysozyme